MVEDAVVLGGVTLVYKSVFNSYCVASYSRGYFSVQSKSLAEKLGRFYICFNSYAILVAFGKCDGGVIVVVRAVKFKSVSAAKAVQPT